ncbi:MAG: putative nucleic acid-binding Zn ribbon protein [Myxococcota bacterium]
MSASLIRISLIPLHGRHFTAHELEELAEQLVIDLQLSGLLRDTPFMSCWTSSEQLVCVELMEPDALEFLSGSPRVQATLSRCRRLGVRVLWDPLFEACTSDAQVQSPWPRPDRLLLFSHLLWSWTPLQDFDRNAVPVYRLDLSEGLREDLYRWSRTYSALDNLFIGSGALEIESYEQLASPRSQFGQESRDLAQRVEAETGIPTFAFFNRYWGLGGLEDRVPCLSCGAPWTPVNQPRLVEVCCLPCRIASPNPPTNDSLVQALVGTWPGLMEDPSFRNAIHVLEE